MTDAERAISEPRISTLIRGSAHETGRAFVLPPGPVMHTR